VIHFTAHRDSFERPNIGCRVVPAASELCLNLERKFRELLLPILRPTRYSIQHCLNLIFGHEDST
jgi:hypothetical protein